MYVYQWVILSDMTINPLNAELNPICHLLALLGAHHILYVSRIRVKKTCLLQFNGFVSVCIVLTCKAHCCLRYQAWHQKD